MHGELSLNRLVQGVRDGVVPAFSTSAGVRYPRDECSRVLLNQSTHSRVANSRSSRPRQGPQCRTSSVLNRPMTVSARALMLL